MATIKCLFLTRLSLAVVWSAFQIMNPSGVHADSVSFCYCTQDSAGDNFCRNGGGDHANDFCCQDDQNPCTVDPSEATCGNRDCEGQCMHPE